MHRAMKIKITDLNPHLTCVLCAGYYVDATTIVECLHSFCKTCIVKYLEGSKFCPICDVQVHKTKPLLSIRSDKTLQDIVYKLVPGLFKAEMKRRREFYALHPDAVLSSASSPEDRGQVHEERFIYTPDEDISLSLEYFLGESKSLSNSVLGVVRPNPISQDCESSNQPDPHRRYLRCTAAVTVAHLKKLIRLKYGLTTMFQVDIIHQRDVLSDDYTLVDVAYIYSWRRNGPMRFFYQIKEYQATPPKRLKLAEEVSLNTVELEVAAEVPTEKTTDVVTPMVVDVSTEMPPEPVISTPAQITPTVTKENGTEIGSQIVSDVSLVPESKKDSVESTKPVSKTTLDKCDKETISVKDKINDKSDSLLRVSKELVVTVTPLVIPTNTNGTNTSATRSEKMNGNAGKDERLPAMPNLPMITTSVKENGDSETPTLVSIGTKEVPVSEVTKDSVVVVVMASNEPPEIPVNSNMNNNNNASCHLNGTISPSPPLQLPIPDISITPIPLSSHTNLHTEAPPRPSLPRDALLATTPQVEIIKKVAPLVANVITSTTAATTVTTNGDTNVTTSDVTLTVTPVTTVAVASAVVTTTASSTVSTLSTASTTTIIKTSSSDTTTITITSSPGANETPASVPPESNGNGNTNGNDAETMDEQPKHDNIGALDLSKNSRATPLRLLPPPSSPTASLSSSPSHTPSPTFTLPPLLRVPSQAHVHPPTKTTSSSPLTPPPPPPPPTFHVHSRSVPAALSAAAARPLFVTSRPPHHPVAPIHLNPMKSSPIAKSGMNGTQQLSRSYPPHHHHHGHHHHGSHGHHSSSHQTRTPKNILSAMGVMAVKTSDYHHRMVLDKPVSGLNNFHNGGKVDTTSSTI